MVGYTQCIFNVRVLIDTVTLISCQSKTNQRNCKPSLPINAETDTSCSGTDMITFEVGEHRQPFLVHKNYACHYSPFLKVMFDGVWPDTPSRRVNLTEVCPEVFNMFQVWLYTQNLHRVLKDKGDDVHDMICELWVSVFRHVRF